jgi:MFS family permease
VTPLRSADFRRLWVAGLISGIGDWVLLVSLPVLVYQLTGSAAGTSAAFLVELVPGVVVAMLAGRLADRLDRRRLLVGISLAQAVALLPLLYGPHLAVIYPVIALQAGLGAAFDPAKNALLPTLVGRDQLVAANALIGLNQNLGRLIGGALGGVLLTVAGLPAIAAVDAVSFLLAMALIWRVRTASRRPTTAKGGRGRLRPLRAGLLVVGISAVGQGMFVVLFVVFVARALHGGAAETGLLRALQAVGAIGGGLLLARLARLTPQRLAGAACLLFGGLALCIWNLPPLTTAAPVYAALFIACGVPGIALMTGLVSWVQQVTADGERGRAFAAFGIVFALGQAIGIVVAGTLGDRWSVVTLLDLQAALYLLGGLLALVSTVVVEPGPHQQERDHDEQREPAAFGAEVLQRSGPAGLGARGVPPGAGEPRGVPAEEQHDRDDQSGATSTHGTAPRDRCTEHAP